MVHTAEAFLESEDKILFSFNNRAGMSGPYACLPEAGSRAGRSEICGLGCAESLVEHLQDVQSTPRGNRSTLLFQSQPANSEQQWLASQSWTHMATTILPSLKSPKPCQPRLAKLWNEAGIRLLPSPSSIIYGSNLNGVRWSEGQDAAKKGRARRLDHLWLISEWGLVSFKPSFVAGEEAEAKRAKKEGQDDAAAAKVFQGWAVSPAELREAVCSLVPKGHPGHTDLSEMHDASEVRPYHSHPTLTMLGITNLLNGVVLKYTTRPADVYM